MLDVNKQLKLKFNPLFEKPRRPNRHRFDFPYTPEYLSEHNLVAPPFISEQFRVLAKGSNKFDCLIKEILVIRKTQTIPKRAGGLDSRKGIHL